MAFILRFVQRFRPEDREAFMALESEFVQLEKRRADFPKGRRYQPYAGRDQTCAFIWECEFESLADVEAALSLLGSDKEHEALYRQQAPLMTETFTEIFETLSL